MRLIDADKFKDYILEGLAGALPKFKSEGSANFASEVTKSFLEDIDEQPTVAEEPGKERRWIPVSERMPEEHDSIFKRFKGTSIWRTGMSEKRSGRVLATVVNGDGTAFVEVLRTEDGEWKSSRYGIRWKVVAWMPLPEPCKEE